MDRSRVVVITVIYSISKVVSAEEILAWTIHH